MGRTEPRLITPLPGGTENHGDQVAKWSEDHLGLPLMEWQRLAVDHSTSYFTSTERFVHRQHLTSVARQSGKTHLLKAICGWWSTEHAAEVGPQTIVITAHNLTLCSLHFNQLAPILEGLGAELAWSYGRQRAMFPDGTRVLVQASTAAAGHGLSIDLLLADELWNIPSVAFDQGFIPAMRARPNAIALTFSTAGTEASDVMLRLREQGTRAIDQGEPGKVGLCEWSPPPGVNTSDPQWWSWSNPALGHTIELDTLIAESQSPEHQAWLRSGLNLFVASEKAWLEAGLWPSLQREHDPITGGVLVAEVSTDGRRFSALRAVTEAEVTHVEVSGIYDTEHELWAHITDVMTDRTVSLAISPTLEVHLPEDLKERYRTVGFGEIQKWTSLVRSAAYDRRVTHRGQGLLDEHVARAVGVKTQGGYCVSSTKSPGPIELCRMLIWAVALASKPERPKRKPTLSYSA